MRTIMLLNAKGGCGKSTLASNLASYYAASGNSVALVDFDPQKSGLEWLAARSEDDWEIMGIDEPSKIRTSFNISIDKPDKMLILEGLHCAIVKNALLNLRPSSAKLSILGVSIFSFL